MLAFTVMVTAPALGAPLAVEGDQAGSDFGGVVAGAGDVDGDGYRDFLVGSEYFATTLAKVGRVQLYRGGPGGAPSLGWTAVGTQEWALFGRYATGAGDVDGDGFHDVLVGATGYANGHADEGAVFLYSGSREGLSAAPVWSAEGNAEGCGLGAVAPAGSVDGDRFADVLIGAPSRAYLYHGGPKGLGPVPAWAAEGRFGPLFGQRVAGAGDVNGDGFSDVLIGGGAEVLAFHGSSSGLSHEPAWSGTPPPGVTTWGSAISGAGDVDGDGFDDVLVGASQDRVGAEIYETGSVFLYRGSPAGLEAEPAWTYHWPVDEAAYLGASVASAGDADGDGFDDVLVGVPGQRSADRIEGRVLVFRGSASGLSATPFRTLAPGSEATGFGWSLAGIGDLDGGGRPDFVIGDPTHDAEAGPDVGAAYLFLR